MNVFPTNWWVGMKYSHIQIMLYSPNVAKYQLQMKADGVTLTSVRRTGNPNYLLVYIETKGAAPQTIQFQLSAIGKEIINVPFELKERKHETVTTFDSSDVTYLIVPDRFAQGDTDEEKQQKYQGMKEDHWDRYGQLSRHGGDLKGMRQHLDYLEWLGVTAIWPSCMLENNNTICSYHGYGVTNHYRIDPRFGTNEEYCAFIQEAQQRGMKVIMDFVFNHCSDECFLFSDLISPYWFEMHKSYMQTNFKVQNVIDPYSSVKDHELATKGWFNGMLPSFAGENSEVRQYLIQSTLWWIEYAGINGIRMDTYPYNDWDLMQQWCEAIEQEHPGFNIVGETWLDSNVGISYWQKDSKLAKPRNSQLPSVMDFPLYFILNSVFDEETDDWGCGLTRIVNYICQDYVFAHPKRLMTFISNHDTSRFSRTWDYASNNLRYKQALTLLLTLRGMPQLYYGDEVAMTGVKDGYDFGQRQNFPGGFPGDNIDVFHQQNLYSLMSEYLYFTHLLLNWRKQEDVNPIIAYGKLIHFNARYGVYVYARELGGKMITFMINGTWHDVELPLEPYYEVLPAEEAKEMLSGRTLDFRCDHLHLSKRDIFIIPFL